MYGVPKCATYKKFKAAHNMLQNITSTVLRQKNDCSLPCKITYLTLENSPSPENDNKTRTFTFSINSVHTLTKSEPIYTFWEYIGEFGGWVGLFIGISIIDLFDIFVDCFKKVMKIRS